MHGQAIAGLSAALIYSVLAGLSVPTQRTLIMLCIYFALRWHRRTLAFGQSLGLALIEAMHLGMPVVALATTEAPEAVPAAAGVLSTSVERVADAARGFLADAERARKAGVAAREAALQRFGLQRFLDDWDDLLEEVAA